jgi:hypothetical protein
MEGDPNENLALVVRFVGAVLAGGHSCHHPLASGVAPIHPLSLGWPFIRRNFRIAAGDFVSARTRLWLSR